MTGSSEILEYMTDCWELQVMSMLNLYKPFMETGTSGRQSSDEWAKLTMEMIEETIRSTNHQNLSYENLCMHPNVEFPPRYKILTFNTYDGKRDLIAHLKDYCSRLVKVGHVESIKMKLFIQSLSGPTLIWYTKQVFGK
ncbi:hypothetical protein RND71_039747 [Anisodus tanguticus]|uniref:Retrotransposon gag domain-containing protein n=1 Tax=Anisodus tanguticus TaxID=243964 RepID=A0AAE1UVM1_9SOLA|nr:hypothetical protein RND71_039747 [Anisodus tanguticus]